MANIGIISVIEMLLEETNLKQSSELKFAVVVPWVHLRYSEFGNSDKVSQFYHRKGQVAVTETSNRL